MAAPSEPFTIIADASVDPDSPLTTGLMLALKRNDIHLEEWLGLSFVAAQDHDHDGVNSKGVIGASLIFIERHESAADEVSFDFSATLDGDTEAVYLLTGRLKDDSTSAPTLTLRANAASTGVVVASIGALGGIDFAYFMGLIFAKRTVQTITMRSGYVGISVDDVGPTFTGRGDGFILGANLASLGLVASTTIRKGSSFTLYRLAQA